MEISVKTVKLSTIKVNPDNPRQINKTELNRLVKSLKDFPEMMQLREIVVDEDMVILGGNMRHRALRQIGEKECIVKIVRGLTPEQKREFIIKDNGTFGEWDMDLLSGWDDLPLMDWGVEIPKHWVDPGDSIKKNFTGNYGGNVDEDEHPAEMGTDGKCPVTFILNKPEYEKWIAAKERLKIKSDKAAFLKIIGGV